MKASSKAQQAQSRAMADALSGVIGGLVAMIAFYPLDTIKTHVQASTSSSSSGNHNHNLYKNDDDDDTDTNDTARKGTKNKEYRIIDKIIGGGVDIRSLFRGIHLKCLHTVSSSFFYFYIYSFLQSHHRSKKSSKSSGNDESNNKNNSVGEQMVLAALAAMLNVLITLPFDVISARQQANRNQDYCPMKKKDIVHSSSSIRQKLHKKFHWTSYWSGLGPALFLCSNPAIHFTIYDVLRVTLLNRRKINKSIQNNGHSLSIVEAFFLGMIAKSFATIITYPLIRTKVLLMTKGEESFDTNNSPTMIQTIKKILETEGVPGLYKGCDLQLMHAVLKSALLMTVRERITMITYGILLDSETKKGTSSSLHK